MLVKLGKQVKLQPNGNFTSKYGTVNAIAPQSIFVAVNSWVTPTHNLRFDKKLRKLNLIVRDAITENIDSETFHKKHILDFDLRQSGLRKGKQSFLSIEITLYPKTVIPFPSDIYDSNIKALVGDLSRQIKQDRDFTFANKKKNKKWRKNLTKMKTHKDH